jgi:electron transport complex protein RnfD
MKKRDPDLLLFHAPLLRQGMTTPKAMRDVLYALAPATLASMWYFGLSAVLILTSCIVGAVAAEWLFADRESRGTSLRDASGILTGLLLGLTLPPGLPLWMAFLGGFAAIALGKVIWGGIGHNLFNPALLGRAFLLATFPIAMTTWAPPQADGGFFQLYDGVLALPFMQAEVDGISAATPLGLMKFEQQASPLADLAFGHISGSLGETSGILLLLGGLYLWARRDLDWRIPVSGLLLGAIYMATDPVTSPLTPKGAWIFGIGIGVLVVLIRVFGGLPEGVMYAILLMNAATPLIDRYTQPRVFGHEVKTE